MFAELIKDLTTEDRKALAERGVPSSRVSEWKTGFRLPTRPQVLALADLKGLDPMQLEKEIVLIEMLTGTDTSSLACAARCLATRAALPEMKSR